MLRGRATWPRQLRPRPIRPAKGLPANRPRVRPASADAAPNAPETARFHTVSLRVDGNIAGRTRVIDASGNLVPVRATITFMQERARCVRRPKR